MGTCLWELGCGKQPSRFIRLTPTNPLQKAGTVAHPGNPNTLGGDARLRLWRAGGLTVVADRHYCTCESWYGIHSQ